MAMNIGAPNSLARNLANNSASATEIAMRLYNALYAVQQRRLNTKGKYTTEDIEREFAQVADALAFAQGSLSTHFATDGSGLPCTIIGGHRGPCIPSRKTCASMP